MAGLQEEPEFVFSWGQVGKVPQVVAGEGIWPVQAGQKDKQEEECRMSLRPMPGVRSGGPGDNKEPRSMLRV